MNFRSFQNLKILWDSLLFFSLIQYPGIRHFSLCNEAYSGSILQNPDRFSPSFTNRTIASSGFKVIFIGRYLLMGRN